MRFEPLINTAAGPFSSQPSGLRGFWSAALSLIGQRPQRVFSLFASRIQPKYAAAPLHQSLTWCTRALILASCPNNLARLLRVISSFIRYWPNCQACCVRHICVLDDTIDRVAVRSSFLTVSVSFSSERPAAFVMISRRPFFSLPLKHINWTTQSLDSPVWI
jgi:hypothetical protein